MNSKVAVVVLSFFLCLGASRLFAQESDIGVFDENKEIKSVEKILKSVINGIVTGDIEGLMKYVSAQYYEESDSGVIEMQGFRERMLKAIDENSHFIDVSCSDPDISSYSFSEDGKKVHVEFIFECAGFDIEGANANKSSNPIMAELVKADEGWRVALWKHYTRGNASVRPEMLVPVTGFIKALAKGDIEEAMKYVSRDFSRKTADNRAVDYETMRQNLMEQLKNAGGVNPNASCRNIKVLTFTGPSISGFDNTSMNISFDCTGPSIFTKLGEESLSRQVKLVLKGTEWKIAGWGVPFNPESK